jgi:predicted CopG family antitoxin
MSKTVTITIPNELYGKLQEFKGKYNISKLCTAAISKIIEIEDCKKYKGGLKHELLLQNQLSGIGINLEEIVRYTEVKGCDTM